jgi:hypothetical protein
MMTRTTLTPCGLLMLALASACADDGDGQTTASGGASSTGAVTPTTGTSSTGNVTPTSDAPTGTASSEGTASASEATITGTGGTTGTTGAPGTTSTSGEDSTAGSGSSTGAVMADLGGDSSTGEPPACGRGGGGDLEFSYIWISNSAEGTLTKLNTVTLVEEGRYMTRADKIGSPSRTSVNLSGDVVVANRQGGVTKFFARIEDCPEKNGVPGIQSSSGKADVLAWDLEECRAWHTPLPGNSNRPVAWTSGVQDPVSCLWEDQKVWTSTTNLGQPGSMKVLRLDGASGMVEATVNLPAVDIGSWGAYGGAVDGQNNFWMTTHGGSNPPSLTRVRFDDLSVKTWPAPPGLATYGMSVDAQGRPWVAGYTGGVARFSPDSETWDVVPQVTGLGLQADGEGRVWVGSYPNPGVTAIDVDTLAVVQTIPLAAQVTKGVSVDFFGNVWVVTMGAEAFRVDPESLKVDVYAGLNGAYTYSDMTGWGLNNVIPQ